MEVDGTGSGGNCLEEFLSLIKMQSYFKFITFYIFSGQGEAFETSVKNYLGEKELKDQFIALRFVLNIY